MRDPDTVRGADRGALPRPAVDVLAAAKGAFNRQQVPACVRPARNAPGRDNRQTARIGGGGGKRAVDRFPNFACTAEPAPAGFAVVLHGGVQECGALAIAMDHDPKPGVVQAPPLRARLVADVASALAHHFAASSVSGRGCQCIGFLSRRPGRAGRVQTPPRPVAAGAVWGAVLGSEGVYPSCGARPTPRPL